VFIVRSGFSWTEHNDFPFPRPRKISRGVNGGEMCEQLFATNFLRAAGKFEKMAHGQVNKDLP
jgi:hypothetical protein